MVKNILGLGRRRAEAEAERKRLVDVAYQLYLRAATDAQVMAALADAGAPPAQAETIREEAATLAESEIVATVTLPPSARLELNYYFLLGVTPRASADRIRAAYRRKAKEVHPDTHASDFTPGQWDDFMKVLTDAHQVLSDPLKRRAYDIFWRHRSREVAALFRRPGERRGDWETRYLWEMAEMGEREDGLATATERLAAAVPGTTEFSTVLQNLRVAVERYETALVEVRTQTRVLPEQLRQFTDRARLELQRKERLVKALRELLAAARAPGPDNARLPAASASSLAVIEEIRQAQHSFDLLHARSHI